LPRHPVKIDVTKLVQRSTRTRCLFNNHRPNSYVCLRYHVLFQDTIVALQSLAEMASKVYSKNFNANVQIKGPPESFISENFVINTNNSLILQSREVIQFNLLFCSRFLISNSIIIIALMIILNTSKRSR